MKKLIKKLLRETILLEKLTHVDDDVNLLYDKYFKHDIDIIEKTGLITPDMFKKSETDTSILISPDSFTCHELNPCVIIINSGHNHYNPNHNRISLSYSSNALNFIQNQADGNIKRAISFLPSGFQKKSMEAEFTEHKIKGSIHHELVHWIDDTLNNSHIKTAVNKKQYDYRNMNVNATKIEIQGQIHNIKQLYNKYKNVWDEISFQDMLDMSSSLLSINDGLKGETNAKWRKELKQRMNREGLLGKNMR